MLDDYADLKIRCLKAEMANECHVETILQLTDERDKARAELERLRRLWRNIAKSITGIDAGILYQEMEQAEKEGER